MLGACTETLFSMCPLTTSSSMLDCRYEKISATTPTFPMRLNKYLAWKKFSTRKASDELIKKGQVFINNKKAEVGMMVQKSDVVEVKFRGKPTPYVYYAYNKPKGVSLQQENAEGGKETGKGTKGESGKQRGKWEKEKGKWGKKGKWESGKE